MPIRSVSAPENLRDWNPRVGDSRPFYFELLGETEPVIRGGALTAVAPANTGVDGSPHGSSIYEYSWTIGHEARISQRSRGSRRLRRGSWMWDQLANEGATVYLFFPTDHGWRIDEIAATVKYLTPIPHDPTLSERAASAMTTVQPLLRDASQMVSLVQPGLGGAASAAAQTLDVLAQMKINQVPQVGGWKWTVSKVTRVSPSAGMYEGVRWSLPGQLFRDLDSRITGSLAVRFFAVRSQAADDEDPTEGAVEAHAVVRPRGENPIWVPSQSTFISLGVRPRAPSA